MIRRVAFIRRRNGLTPAEFLAHWRGRHAELVRSAPQLRGLRFTPNLRSQPGTPQWDGIGETWFDSLADCERAFSEGPLAKLLAEDRALFIGEAQVCFVEESAAAVPPDAKAAR